MLQLHNIGNESAAYIVKKQSGCTACFLSFSRYLNFKPFKVLIIQIVVIPNIWDPLLDFLLFVARVMQNESPVHGFQKNGCLPSS